MKRRNYCIARLFVCSLLVWLAFLSVWTNEVRTANRKVSRFGIHAVGLPFLKEVDDLGSSIVRLIISNPVWNMIETERGLDFTKLDFAVRTLQENGLDIVITFMPNSKKWGATDLFAKRKSTAEPTVHADYPAKYDLYKETITAIVERYDGDRRDDMPGLGYPIDYYQLVNEWVWQWEGTKEDYLRYLKDSRKIIRVAHPGARIILGGLTGVEFWAISEGIDKNRTVKTGGMYNKDKPETVSFESLKSKVPGHVEKTIERLKYILVKGRPYFDIIDFHSYTEHYQEMVPSIKILKKYAPDKELWSLENAGPFYRYSPEKHCQEIVKRYIVGFYYGVDKIFWSSYNPTGGWSKNFLNLSLLTNRGGKKPAYFMYKFLAVNLSALRSVEKLDLGSGVEAYRLSENSRDVYVIWAEGRKTTVELRLKGTEEALQLVSYNVRRSQIQKSEKKLIVRDRHVKVEVSETPVFLGKRFKSVEVTSGPEKPKGPLDFLYKKVFD